MNTFPDVDVLIPYRPSGGPHREANMKFIRRHLESVFPEANLTLCDDDDPILFNRGRAVNVGVEATERPILVIADGDVWFPSSSLREAVATLRRKFAFQRSYVVPFDKVIWMDGSWSRGVLDGSIPIASRPPAPHIVLEWGQCSVGICNVVTRKAFDRLGGFDHRFHGWGGEDIAWDYAAETLISPKLRLRGEGRHLYHPTCPSKEDPKGMAQMAGLLGRYGAARGDRTAMRALIEERTITN